jgi:hypothetical protein
VIALSFVIVTTGARQSVLDEVVLPGIFEQSLSEYEVIVVGRYAGRHLDRIRVIGAPTGAAIFYKPFQRGALAARHPWVVDLDDDMLLAGDWAVQIAAAQLQQPGIFGFRLTHADGALFGTYFDAIDNCYNGKRLPTSYFGSSVAPAELFRRVPYPSYQSGDRVHALRTADVWPALPRTLLEGVEVTHLGQSMGHPGSTPKTTLDQIAATRPLLEFLRTEAIAWAPFADRYVEGRPKVTLDELWTAAHAAVGDPVFARRHHWLV